MSRIACDIAFEHLVDQVHVRDSPVGVLACQLDVLQVRPSRVRQRRRRPLVRRRLLSWSNQNVEGRQPGRISLAIAQELEQVDKIGCLKPGAFADLLVIDGNPLANLGVLQEQGKYLAVIMKGGRFHKNRLN